MIHQNIDLNRFCIVTFFLLALMGVSINVSASKKVVPSPGCIETLLLQDLSSQNSRAASILGKDVFDSFGSNEKNEAIAYLESGDFKIDGVSMIPFGDTNALMVTLFMKTFDVNSYQHSVAINTQIDIELDLVKEEGKVGAVFTEFYENLANYYPNQAEASAVFSGILANWISQGDANASDQAKFLFFSSPYFNQNVAYNTKVFAHKAFDINTRSGMFALNSISSQIFAFNVLDEDGAVFFGRSYMAAVNSEKLNGLVLEKFKFGVNNIKQQVRKKQITGHSRLDYNKFVVDLEKNYPDAWVFFSKTLRDLLRVEGENSSRGVGFED